MTEAIRTLGWDEDWATAWDEAWAAVQDEAGDAPRTAVLARRASSEGQPARVTAQQRDRWTIHGDAGPRSARLLGSAWAGHGMRPVTGDWVVVSPGPHPSDPWGILAVLPRRSAVRRGAAGPSGVEQVLAANVDRLWIVQPLDRPPNLRSLERYLAVAWESGAAPEIVLTKSDLAEDPSGATEAVRAIAFGVPVWTVGMHDGAALDALRATLVEGETVVFRATLVEGETVALRATLVEGETVALRATLVAGETVALLGPSGAGKSTLINRLAEAEVAPTGAVRAGDRKGRHTTTGRELFPIHGGALLLDTPGMRELRVLDLEEGLEHAFPDIDRLAGRCRFRDCSHASEPGCAVLAAVADGRLAADRLASFRKLEAEAAYERRRTDPRAREEHLAERKTALRTLKYHPKHRQGE